jgi:hypothetical protein
MVDKLRSQNTLCWPRYYGGTHAPGAIDSGYWQEPPLMTCAAIWIEVNGIQEALV